MAENKKQTEQKQETKKRVKLSLPSIKEMFDLSVAEFETAKNMLAVGDTLGKVKNYFEKQRKTEKAEKERTERQNREREEIAKKAIELAKEAKELYNEMLNVPEFKDFSKVYLTIKNVSQYTSYRGKTWKIYGKRKIQDIDYLVTEEYEKEVDGKTLFDMPCYIPISDVYLDYNNVMIRSYERSKQGGYNEITMKYEKVK